jgi:hypothetical protein
MPGENFQQNRGKHQAHRGDVLHQKEHATNQVPREKGKQNHETDPKNEQFVFHGHGQPPGLDRASPVGAKEQV